MTDDRSQDGADDSTGAGATMTEAEAIDLLAKAAMPTKRDLAEKLGISPQYLGDVLAGRRDPAHVLARFGLRRVITYEKAKG